MKAQILLITLLVLAIISIVVLGIISVTSSDLDQVANNEKYEVFYNSSETELRQFIDSNWTGSLATLCQSSTNADFSLRFDCGTKDFTQGELSYTTSITATDRRGLEGFNLYKDQSFEIKLDNYRSSIDVKWDKDIAMEFSLVYRTVSNSYAKVLDVYDPSAVYNSTGTDDFTFSVIPSVSAQRGVRVSIGNTLGITAADYLVSVVITPRSKINNDIVSIDVSAADPLSFPFQSRKFNAITFDSSNTVSPVTNITSQIPLTSQPSSIFDYTIFLENNLSL